LAFRCCPRDTGVGCAFWKAPRCPVECWISLTK